MAIQKIDKSDMVMVEDGIRASYKLSEKIDSAVKRTVETMENYLVKNPNHPQQKKLIQAIKEVKRMGRTTNLDADFIRRATLGEDRSLLERLHEKMKMYAAVVGVAILFTGLTVGIAGITLSIGLTGPALLAGYMVIGMSVAIAVAAVLSYMRIATTQFNGVIPPEHQERFNKTYQGQVIKHTNRLNDLIDKFEEIKKTPAKPGLVASVIKFFKREQATIAA